MALQSRFMAKKRPRTAKETMLLFAERPRRVESALESVLVWEVVVSLAKTPLKAAKAPEPSAQVSHWVDL